MFCTFIAIIFSDKRSTQAA